jgi:hypothetical protein
MGGRLHPRRGAHPRPPPHRLTLPAAGDAPAPMRPASDDPKNESPSSDASRPARTTTSTARHAPIGESRPQTAELQVNRWIED